MWSQIVQLSPIQYLMLSLCIYTIKMRKNVAFNWWIQYLKHVPDNKHSLRQDILWNET